MNFCDRCDLAIRDGEATYKVPKGVRHDGEMYCINRLQEESESLMRYAEAVAKGICNCAALRNGGCLTCQARDLVSKRKAQA